MAEGTQPTAAQREAEIQQALAQSKPQELAGSVAPGIPIDAGKLPVSPVVQEVKSAGYVWVWDTRTNEKIPILAYMLPQKMRLRRPDGSFRFTPVDPGVPPKRGEHKCLLHADDANRLHYDELGLPTCRKSNLINRYQVLQHMKRKHPQEWLAIEQETKDRERQEDRYFQQAVAAQLAKEGLVPPTP